MPCQEIVLEYLVYKLYNELTPKSRARLVRNSSGYRSENKITKLLWDIDRGRGADGNKMADCG